MVLHPEPSRAQPSRSQRLVSTLRLRLNAGVAPAPRPPPSISVATRRPEPPSDSKMVDSSSQSTASPVAIRLWTACPRLPANSLTAVPPHLGTHHPPPA